MGARLRRHGRRSSPPPACSKQARRRLGRAGAVAAVRARDLLSDRGLRCPPGYWGLPAVIWGRTQSWWRKYVLDGVGGSRNGAAAPAARVVAGPRRALAPPERPDPPPPSPSAPSKSAAASLVRYRPEPLRAGLLHEGREALARGCAYCTNARTPRSTPDPPPVAPDPRAVLVARRPRPGKRPGAARAGVTGETGLHPTRTRYT